MRWDQEGRHVLIPAVMCLHLTCGCGHWALLVVGWSDRMILEIFSNLNDYESGALAPPLCCGFCSGLFSTFPQQFRVSQCQGTSSARISG